MGYAEAFDWLAKLVARQEIPGDDCYRPLIQSSN